MSVTVLLLNSRYATWPLHSLNPALKRGLLSCHPYGTLLTLTLERVMA